LRSSRQQQSDSRLRRCWRRDRNARARGRFQRTATLRQNKKPLHPALLWPRVRMWPGRGMGVTLAAGVADGVGVGNADRRGTCRDASSGSEAGRVGSNVETLIHFRVNVVFHLAPPINCRGNYRAINPARIADTRAATGQSRRRISARMPTAHLSQSVLAPSSALALPATDCCDSSPESHHHANHRWFSECLRLVPSGTPRIFHSACGGTAAPHT
jgi:hypothetical protein